MSVRFSHKKLSYVCVQLSDTTTLDLWWVTRIMGTCT